MKLHLGLKIIALVLVLGGIASVFYKTDKSQDAIGIESPLAIVDKTKSEVFDSKHAVSLTWTVGEKKILCTPLTCDLWSYNRRLVLLSELNKPISISIPKPVGEIVITLSGEPKVDLRGSYDEKGFVWNTGPFSGKGFLFESDNGLRNIFKEGLEGLSSHELVLCQSDKLNKISVENNSIRLESNKWFIYAAGENQSVEKKVGPAVREYVLQLLKQICRIPVTYYVPGEKLTSNVKTVLILQKKPASNNFVDQITFRRLDGVYFVDGVITFGHSSFIPFSSEVLDRLVQIKISDFLDLSYGYLKTMLDNTKDQQERLRAIREVKRLKSPEALPALGQIMFEKNQLDVYRFEALDALVEIGTRDAYKIIADKLAKEPSPQVQLRLAKALAGALSEPIAFDENTPKKIRQVEIQKLLSVYKKHPAGS